jgi:hypothetical protein
MIQLSAELQRTNKHMNRSFNTILAAQFFSSLADNALLFAAIALLKNLDAPSWQTPVLQQFFVFAFIVLALLAHSQMHCRRDRSCSSATVSR